MIFASGLMLYAGDGSGEAAKVPPLDKQTNYFRELAIFHGINAEIQQAQAVLAADRPLLEEQRKKLAAAGEAAIASCGEKFTIDQQRLAKAELVCIPKPEPKTPEPPKEGSK